MKRWWIGAGLFAAALTCAAAHAATVKKADDITVTGPLVALENGAVVINADGANPPRTPIALEDVVEITIDASKDVPPAAPVAPPKPSTAPAKPGEPAPPTPAPERAVATSNIPAIFDGKTLKGWTGEQDVWSVKDGVLTGAVTDNTISDKVTYLIYEADPELTDFELHYKFKITGGMRNSSGVQFRSKIIETDGHQDVNGYQQDLGGLPGLTGGFVDSGMSAGNSNTKAAPGERAVYNEEGAREPSGLAKSGVELTPLVKDGQWNDAVLVVQGKQFVSMINGETFAELINDHPAGAKSGVLAFQLSRRRVVTAEFKDIKLRKLGASDKPEVRGLLWDRVRAEAEAARKKAGITVAASAVPTTQPAPAAAPATRPTSWQARLAGGDRITGDLVAWDDKELKLKTAHGEVVVPVRQLREVWRASDDEIAKARAAGASANNAATEDVAFARKDDQAIPVAGLVTGVAKDGLKFRYQGEEKNISLDKLIGVTLASAEADNAVAVADEALQQSLVLSGGNVVSGQWTALDQGIATLSTPWGAALKVPLKDVQSIRTKNGRLVYLSDLAPAQVEQTPYFDRLLPYRIDKSLTGTAIKLSDAEYPRGISVHSRTVLRYDIGRRFEKFRAKVGFQQPEGKAGRATIRVLGDGDKVLHEIADARGDAPPVDLDIPVTGVSRLTLEVDFGADQDVADRVAWANARLLRAAKAPK
jgi:hypothetical protein